MMSGKKKFSQTNCEKLNGIYKLIEFIAKDKCKGRCVDIVPCDWIAYDNTSGNLKTVFMPPPYKKQTTEVLHSLVKNRAEPPKLWPSYEINIVGEAKTYELALIKLKKLEEKKYVYSTESDHGENRSLSDKKKYKFKATKADHYMEKTLLKVPPLQSDDDTYSLFSESSKESGTISNNENTKSHAIRKNECAIRENECEETYNCSAKTNISISKKVEKELSKGNKQKKKVENFNTTKGQYNDNIISNTEHSIEENSSFCQFDERKDTFNDLARLISSGFRSICTQLTQLTLTINELKNILSLEKNNNLQICTDIQFVEKHGIEFPCKTLADFMQFEEKLKSNEFRQDFELNLWKTVDTSATVIKSLTNILKKYMSRDLAMTFTAVKKMEGKQILKTTIFSSCIQKVLIEEYSKLNRPPITDKIYYSTLGSVLNNVKDWEGHRLLRQKKFNPVNDESEESDNDDV